MAELTDEERIELYPIIFKNDFNDIESLTESPKLRKILKYYKNYRADIADPSTDLYKLKKEFDNQQKQVKFE